MFLVFPSKHKSLSILYLDQKSCCGNSPTVFHIKKSSSKRTGVLSYLGKP
jgi:hypothetical protein